MGDSLLTRTGRHTPVGLALVFLSCVAPLSGLAQSQGQTPVGGIYTCVDGKGRKLTSDRPIAECLDREQKVLNPSGTVRARIGPNLTEKERADIEARAREEAEVRARQVEEKRRERALLNRYPSREVHDRERAAAFGQVAAVAQAAQKRIDALLLDRRKLDQEMEFYQKDPSRAPPSLRRQIDEIEQGVLAQQRFIAEREIELKRISARFDEEAERLQPLWALHPKARAPAAGSPRQVP